MNTWRAKIHLEIEFCNTSSFIGAPHNKSMLRLVLRRTNFYGASQNLPMDLHSMYEERFQVRVLRKGNASALEVNNLSLNELTLL